MAHIMNIEKTHYIVRRTDLPVTSHAGKVYDSIEAAEESARSLVAQYPGHSKSSYTIYKAIEIVRASQPPIEVIYLDGSI